MEAVFAELAADLAPVYRRRGLRANGVLYLRGLLMPGVAGNCWSIAEAVGLDRPYRLHHLLERTCWEDPMPPLPTHAYIAICRFLNAQRAAMPPLNARPTTGVAPHMPRGPQRGGQTTPL